MEVRILQGQPFVYKQKYRYILMHSERDFEKNPYTEDEMKVVNYLSRINPDIGAGSDPITFLIASHSALIQELKDMRRTMKTSSK